MTILKAHPDVWADIDQGAQYYESFDFDLGDRFISAYEDALDFIERYPNAGRRKFRVYRRVIMHTFRHLVIYRVIDDQDIRVLAVVDARRDPEWMKTLLARRVEEY